MKRVCLFLLPAILFAFCGFAAAQSCPVTYTIVNSWNTGFQVSLAIKNTGTTAINGWTVEWTFPGKQQITQLWGGNVSTQGETVTVTNLSWDSSIAVGATMTSVGFTANSNGTNTNPTAFVLNGVVC